MDEPDDIEIAFLLLADGAQSVGGKLYVLGGGWDQLNLLQVPGRGIGFSVALGVRVPWTHTNRPFTLGLELVDADGDRIGEELATALDTGRPAGLRAGTPQNLPVTFFVNPEFPAVGAYRYVAKIDGEIKKSVGLTVAQMPSVAG